MGLGTEAVQRVVYALGQMKAAGRVTAPGTWCSSPDGHPRLEDADDAVGIVAVPEAKKAAEQGLIDADTAIKGITEAIETGNMGGMMAAQARTFNGAMSTIKDTIQIVVASAFKPLFDDVSGLALAVADFLARLNFLNGLENVGRASATSSTTSSGAGQQLWEIASGVLPTLFDSLGSVVDVALRGLDVLLTIAGGLVSAFGGLAPILMVVVGPLVTILATMKGLSIAWGLVNTVMAISNTTLGISGTLFSILSGRWVPPSRPRCS